MTLQRTTARPATATLPARLWLWTASALLLSPVYLLYLAHFTVHGASGTGFLQYDQASYMADARAYFASGHFNLTYALPFSADPATPRLYFQPLTLALGLAWKLTGSDPGILYAAAGLLLALVCARVVVALYQEIVGVDRPGAALGLLCFFWGGGVVALAGFIHGLTSTEPPLAHMLDYDPFGGFWFLNLGRNLIFTTEAFYHLIFLSGILLVLRRRFAAALACAALLSASHPFSGLQLIAVLGVWGIVERIFGGMDRPPRFFLVMLTALGAFHVGYYLCFLDYASKDHHALHQQWSLDWVLPVSSMLAAYGPVALLAATAVVTRWRHGHLFTRVDRLLLIWAAVSLALAKHDLLIAPVQPLHFTRGYIWTPLFLLGAPLLVRAFGAASGIAVARLVVPCAIVGLFLSDNAVWFLLTSSAEHRGAQNYGLTLDPQEHAVIETFRDPRYAGYLIVSQSEKLGYLATAYSPLRSWRSHRFSTPQAKLREAEINRFFAYGAEPSGWHDRPILAVAERDRAAAVNHLEDDGFHPVLTNERFVILARATVSAPTR